MKIIIGLVGENGSGKGSFVNILSSIAPNKVESFKSSAFLLETLQAWNIEATRANLQKIAYVMEREFGEGLVAKAVVERMKESAAEIVIFDGVRWQSQVDALRAAFENVLIVYVTADRDVRFERLTRRHEKQGEAGMTQEQFLTEEQAPTEVQIPRIGAEADYVIRANGDLDELRGYVQEFYEKRLK